LNKQGLYVCMEWLRHFTLFRQHDALCTKCIAPYGTLQLLLQFCYVVTFCVAKSSYFLRILSVIYKCGAFS
jgi:uncharacterized membrane protein